MVPNPFYVAGEIIVGLLAVIGNALVIYVFFQHKRLRVYRNYYIVGLGVADFIIGSVGIPLAIVAGYNLPGDLYGCLFTCSFIVICCAIGILCLLAVSVDRFWATWDPVGYYKCMSAKVVCSILGLCVGLGLLVGILPLFGWYNDTGLGYQLIINHGVCVFPFIMSYDYLLFVYFTIIVTPAVLMAGFYGYIYQFIITRTKKRNQIIQNRQQQGHAQVTADPASKASMSESSQTEKTQRKEARAGKKLSSIILFFLICWFPLNTMNCIHWFCDCLVDGFPTGVWDFVIILSHANSAINPFLYAYHLKEFRVAMRNVLWPIMEVLSCGLFKPGNSQVINVTTQSHSAV